MRISVIGTGYVGLVSGTCFAEMGNRVVCVDNNQSKLEKLRSGEVTIYEPGLEVLFERNIEKKRLEFTDDLKKAVLETDIVFLCLPTPQGEDGSADLQYVLGVSNSLGKILKENNDKDFKIIVDKSTVPVGTAFKVRETIASHGVENFDVVSNPEFLKEGFAVEDFMKPDRIVIGSENREALEKMKELYEPFVRQGNPIIEMNTLSAELTKYASNSYLAMRITFMNELANYCEAVGADVDLVRKGMGTDSRIGKRFLFSGIGYGGSCFPKDVKALITSSKEVGKKLELLSVVDESNNRQKKVLVKKVLSYYNDNIEGKKFGIWGLSFKPNTDDMREAPSIPIIKELLSQGAKVQAYDPAGSENAAYYFGEEIKYAEDMYEALDGVDSLLVLTEWNEFRNPDFEVLKSKIRDKVIFDGRNIFEPEKMKETGLKYYSIGRQPVGTQL